MWRSSLDLVRFVYFLNLISMEDNMQCKMISSLCSFCFVLVWNLSQLRGLPHMHKQAGYELEHESGLGFDVHRNTSEISGD